MIVPIMFGIFMGYAAVGLLDTAFAAIGIAAGAAVGYVSYALLFFRLSSGLIVLDHDIVYWVW